MTELDDLSQTYRGHITKWMGQQGILFQIWHGSGLTGENTSKFIAALIVRSSVLLVAILALGFFCVHKFYNSELFINRLTPKFEETFRAKNVGINQQQYSLLNPYLKLGKIDIQGSESSFYEFIKLRDVSLPFKPYFGILSSPSETTLTIQDCEAIIKSGETNPTVATKSFDHLFSQQTNNLSKILIKKGSFLFGYSKDSRGWIDSSNVSIERISQTAWKAIFTGGQIHWGPLHSWDITRIEFLATPKGLEIVSSEFQHNNAVINLNGVFGGGDQPAFDGQISMSAIPWEKILPEGYCEYLDGAFMAKGTISGSLNSPDGIRLKLNTKLNGEHFLNLKPKLAFANCLGNLGIQTYRKCIHLDRGSIDMEVQIGGKNQISWKNINIGNGQVQISGDLDIRIPSPTETQADMKRFHEGNLNFDVLSSIQRAKETGKQIPEEWNRLISDLKRNKDWDLPEIETPQEDNDSISSINNFQFLIPSLRRVSGNLTFQILGQDIIKKFAKTPNSVTIAPDRSSCSIKVKANNCYLSEIGESLISSINKSTSLRAQEEVQNQAPKEKN